ncbi:2-methylcitrate dehydratase PrpD [Rhizobium fabae]|uniref:2-methylcitrate dehydratase PrpD n=1 Tax=Rhizobium fabae TaxID=573179 RepID=A0A7W6BAI5_9HYPH|nr:2-methylcitrate dehydratase PrpD [Rhizobium fabae]
MSGRQFLEALRLEARAALGSDANPSQYNKGWHATATIGSIGAGAGVARLLPYNASIPTCATPKTSSPECRRHQVVAL